MKKSTITLLLLLPLALGLSAQDYNPFVSGPTISPAPMPDLQSNGSALFSFNIGNSGTLAMPVVGTQSLKISMTLLRGVPNTTGNVSNAVSGSWAQYFSWTFDSFVNTLIGTQIQTLPANASGSITVDYLVTSNSTASSPQNGFNLNLVPPPYSVGTNLQSDDNVSAFSYTVPTAAPNITVGASSTNPSIAIAGSTTINYRINNLGVVPTTGALIDVFISKPTDGTLVLSPPAGWSVVSSNPAYIHLNSNTIIQPGLANSVLIPAVYTHGGLSQNGLKSTNILAAPGSGGETKIDDNQTGTFLLIN